MSLLEMGVQLMILPTTSFRTDSCFESSSRYKVLCPSSVVSSQNPSDLGKAQDVPQNPSDLGKAQDVPSVNLSLMDELMCFSSVETFNVPIVVASFGSLMVIFAPEAYSSPPPWSLTEGFAVFVDPGLDRSGMLFLCCVSIMSSQLA